MNEVAMVFGYVMIGLLLLNGLVLFFANPIKVRVAIGFLGIAIAFGLFAIGFFGEPKETSIGIGFAIAAIVCIVPSLLIFGNLTAKK